MNITLSADKELIERARAYARRHRTTLNRMIRDYMQRLCAGLDPEDAADEFARLALEHGGCSEPGSQFDREAVHERSG